MRMRLIRSSVIVNILSNIIKSISAKFLAKLRFLFINFFQWRKIDKFAS